MKLLLGCTVEQLKAKFAAVLDVAADLDVIAETLLDCQKRGVPFDGLAAARAKLDRDRRKVARALNTRVEDLFGSRSR
jgi:hypothetical protein